MESIIEPPRKCPSNFTKLLCRHTIEIEITDNDSDESMLQDLDSPASEAQAPKHRIIIEMSDDIKPPAKNSTEVTRQAAFEDLNWEPKVLETEAEKQAEWKKNAEWMEAEAESDQMTEAEKAEAKRQRKNELARERQCRHRALIKEQNPKPKRQGKNINEVRQKKKFTCNILINLQVLHDDDAPSELEDLADISRSGSGWKLKCNGQRSGAKQSRSKRTNWYHPFLWPAIDAAACKTHWSPTDIAKDLKLLNPALYKTINKGTISKWIDGETK
jgi:hypothetical protein